MNKKNLKNCWEGLEKQFSVDCPKKVILFDQTDHRELMLDPEKKKPSFFRDIQKIKDHLKMEKIQIIINKKIILKELTMKISMKKISLY